MIFEEKEGKEISKNSALRQILIWLMLGTGGGESRIQIIETLKEHPQNLNRLAKSVGASYTTVKYHINILEEEKLVISRGGNYGKVYFISSLLEDNYGIFKQLIEKRQKQK